MLIYFGSIKSFIKTRCCCLYLFIYLFIYLIIYKVHLNAPRVVKVHHKEHQANEPLARLL